MNRSLRRRHLGIVGVLAVALAAFFVAGLAGRRPGAAVASLPEGMEPDMRSMVWWHSFFTDDIAGPWQQIVEPPVRFRVRFGGQHAGRRLEVAAMAPIAAPDVLVYWGPVGSEPHEAMLLGALRGEEEREWGLPGPAAGDVLFYSLGHQLLLGRAEVRP